MQILIGWLGRAISFVLVSSPSCARRGLAYVLAFLWYDVFRIRRRVVLENLHIAFPEMSLRERVRLGRKSLRGLALNLVEYSYFPWLNKQNAQNFFVVENLELFHEVIARGKGVLLMTCHLGHGDLACAAIALQGYPLVMVSKFFKAQWLNNLWFGMREKLGMRFIPPRDSSYALLKALKSGAAVIIPLDQFTGPPIGVLTTFFGRKTGTAAGLAVMAERSGAPVLGVYTYRRPDGRHAVCFNREMPRPAWTSRGRENIVRITQSFNDELEGYIRQHPDQWLWIHRRWKTFELR